MLGHRAAILFNWDFINSEAELLVVGANVFFDKVINALDDLGVDVTHAGEVAAVLKAIGPKQLEIAFGAGASDKYAMRGRRPIRPTSIVKTITSIQDTAFKNMKYKENEEPLEGVNIVLGSTDVHEFGMEVVGNVLRKAGANVFSLGTAVAIEQIPDTLIEAGSDILIMSTYNGIAYSYGKDLIECLEKNNLSNIHIMMGGRLNEPINGSDVPIDVSDKLNEMGINTDNDIDTLIETILTYRQ